jgi:hypothetical protein
MKLELDTFQITEILQLLLEESRRKKLYFIEHPNDIEGLTTPEDIRKLYNNILKQAHDEGALSFLDPIIVH